MQASKHSGWALAPEPGCTKGRGPGCLLHSCIPQGRLFRVDDGLDEKADEHQRKLDEALTYAKKLEKTR